MASICFYFHVHQPRRVKRYRHFSIGQDNSYFNDESGTSLDNKAIIEKVAKKCYIPATSTLLELLKKHPEFRVSFSFTGILLEQLEEFSPESLKLFQKVIKTGQAEIISETYYHSLAFLYNKDEFVSQVELHSKKIKKLFGVTPKVFRNTELIYNDELAQFIEKMGYTGILTEGADHILGWRSPNFLYRAHGTKNLKVLLKNYRLSDDIAFRFGEKSWKEWPMTAPKFAHWVNAINGNGNVVNLFMDYETLGEHQWEDTGIFEFLKQLPSEILKHPDNDFVTPSEAIARFDAVSDISIPNYISWADVERDLSAWLSNPMQHDASNNLYSIYETVIASKDPEIIENWRRMTTSDHFYYMCTKWFADGDVHKYFNPYETPYDAFRYFMNALTDLRLRLDKTA
jgi:alpha-amylase